MAPKNTPPSRIRPGRGVKQKSGPAKGWSAPSSNKVHSCHTRYKSLAEFCHPQTAEKRPIVFSGGVYVGKHTSQDASVRASASACGVLHPLSKMQAFFRGKCRPLHALRRVKVRTVRPGLTARVHSAPSPFLSQTNPLRWVLFGFPARTLVA